MWLEHQHYAAKTSRSQTGCTILVVSFCSCGQELGSRVTIAHDPVATYDDDGYPRSYCGRCGVRLS